MGTTVLITDRLKMCECTIVMTDQKDDRQEDEGRGTHTRIGSRGDGEENRLVVLCAKQPLLILRSLIIVRLVGQLTSADPAEVHTST